MNPLVLIRFAPVAAKGLWRIVEVAYWGFRAAYELAAWLRKRDDIKEPEALKDLAKSVRMARKQNDCAAAQCTAARIFNVGKNHVETVERERRGDPDAG